MLTNGTRNASVRFATFAVVMVPSKGLYALRFASKPGWSHSHPDAIVTNATNPSAVATRLVRRMIGPPSRDPSIPPTLGRRTFMHR